MDISQDMGVLKEGPGDCAGVNLKSSMPQIKSGAAVVVSIARLGSRNRSKIPAMI